MAAGSGGGMFAQATRRAAEARFKQRDVDAEGQEIDVRDQNLVLKFLFHDTCTCMPLPLSPSSFVSSSSLM